MSFTHAIMFHHFHNQKHQPSQGSISSSEFSNMLDWLNNSFNILGAKEYLNKFENSKLKPNDICLSFDDALLCQYDVALPILRKKKIKAFFFVYSSVYSKKPDNLEIFRYFRTNKFKNINDFYKTFFSTVEKELSENLFFHLKEYKKINYLSEYLIYTEKDRWFRYLRDEILGPLRYEKVMLKLMEDKKFNPKKIIHNLWMSEQHLKEISNLGHVVGLHTFNHPTKISKLSYKKQQKEYEENYKHLNKIVGKVFSMSHPCGDYNHHTLEILEKMGIRIGFRSNLTETKIKGKFEIPRKDHALVLKEMKE